MSWQSGEYFYSHTGNTWEVLSVESPSVSVRCVGSNRPHEPSRWYRTEPKPPVFWFRLEQLDSLENNGHVCRIFGGRKGIASVRD